MSGRFSGALAALALLLLSGGCSKVFSLGDVVEDGGLKINLTCTGILKSLGDANNQCSLNGVVGGVIAGAVGATTVHIGDMVEVEGESPGPLGAGAVLISNGGQQTTVEMIMPAFEWDGTTVVVVPMLPVTQLGSNVDSILIGVNSSNPLKLNVVANSPPGNPGSQTGMFATLAQNLGSFLVAPTGPEAAFYSTILTHMGTLAGDASSLSQNGPSAGVQVGAALTVDSNGVSLMDQLVTGVLEPVIIPAADAGPGEAVGLSSQSVAEQALPLAIALASTVTMTSTATDGGLQADGFSDVSAAATAFLPVAAEVNDAVQLAQADGDQDIQSEQAAWTDLDDTARIEVVEALDAGTVALTGSFETDATTALQDTLTGGAGAFDAGCILNGCPPTGCSDPGGISTCVSSSVCNPATGLCDTQTMICSPNLCQAPHGDAGCSC